MRISGYVKTLIFKYTDTGIWKYASSCIFKSPHIGVYKYNKVYEYLRVLINMPEYVQIFICLKSAYAAVFAAYMYKYVGICVFLYVNI